MPVQVIDLIGRRMRDPVLAVLFANCYPNTLDTTVEMFDEVVQRSIRAHVRACAEERTRTAQCVPCVSYVSMHVRVMCQCMAHIFVES